VSAYIDIGYFGGVEDGDLKELAYFASKLMIRAVAVEGLRGFRELNNVLLVPRVTSSDAASLLKVPSGVIRSLIVKSREDLKFSSRLKRVMHVVTLSKQALLRLDRTTIDKLIMLKLPVELRVNDILQLISAGRHLTRLTRLMRAVRLGKLEVLISSGASSPKLLLHPLVAISLLEELGLDELLAIKMVKHLPYRILMSVRP